MMAKVNALLYVRGDIEFSPNLVFELSKRFLIVNVIRFSYHRFSQRDHVLPAIKSRYLFRLFDVTSSAKVSIYIRF